MKTVQRPRQLSNDEATDGSLSVVTSVRLTEGQIYFLDRFRARVARDTGCRLTRNLLLQVLVDAVGAAQPDLRDVTSEADLTQRLCAASDRRPDAEHR